MTAFFRLGRVMCVGAALTILGSPAQADETAIIVENMYRDSIVKIDVSSNTPVRDKDGKNLCLSEGTGFMVSKSHVVTAAHVFAIPAACGQPIIMVKSRDKHRVQRVATLKSSKNDVALLSVDPIPDRLCSLIISPKTMFSAAAFRYFLPAGITEPEPVLLRIGEEKSPYRPLVSLTPASTFPGDSGGPIIHRFNVVGMMKARHDTYHDLSFMITADVISEVLKENGVQADGSDCNPARYALLASLSGTTHGNSQLKIVFMSKNASTPAFSDLLNSQVKAVVKEKTETFIDFALAAKAQKDSTPIIVSGNLLNDGAASPATAGATVIIDDTKNYDLALPGVFSNEQLSFGQQFVATASQEALKERWWEALMVGLAKPRLAPQSPGPNVQWPALAEERRSACARFPGMC